MRIWLLAGLILVASLSIAVFAPTGLAYVIVLGIALVLILPAILINLLITLSERMGQSDPATLKTGGMPLDMIAPIYDRYCPVIGLGAGFREKTISLAGLKSGDKVLDAGCGTGVLTRFAASAVGPTGLVTGIDPSAKMIEVAKRNAIRTGSLASFRLGVIEALPFEEGSFDAVLSSAMLHHLPPELKDKGLKEVYRVLRPGGRLLLVDIDRPVFFPWWAVIWPLLFWPFAKDQVMGAIGKMMQASGLSGVEKAGSWGGLLGFWRGYKR